MSTVCITELKVDKNRRKLSFMTSDMPDSTEIELLEALKEVSVKDFLKARTGAKNMEAILSHLNVEIEEKLFLGSA